MRRGHKATFTVAGTVRAALGGFTHRTLLTPEELDQVHRAWQTGWSVDIEVLLVRDMVLRRLLAEPRERRSTLSKLRVIAVAAWLILWALPAFAQYTAGQTYRLPANCTYGVDCTTELIAGSVPVIVIAGHGGYLAPANMTTRTASMCAAGGFNTGQDVLTEQQARNLSFYWQPWIVINLVSRTKVDVNRAIGCGAGSDPDNQFAWNRYHDWTKEAMSLAVAGSASGLALVIDLHGYAGDVRGQIAFGLSNVEQQWAAEELDGLANQSTLRAFVPLVATPFSTVLRDFGTRLTRYELTTAGVPRWPSVPSEQDWGVEPESEWIGDGNSLLWYGCPLVTDPVCALQIEMPLGWKDTNANRSAFSRALRDVTREFLAQFGVTW